MPDASDLCLASGTGVTRPKPTLTVSVAVVGLALGVAMSVATATAHAQLPRSPAPLPPEVEQIRLAWVDDSATTMTVRWRGGSENGRARSRPFGTETWTEVQGTVLPTESVLGHELEVRFTDLAPDTDHEYQLSDNDVWTDSYRFRTTSNAGNPVTAAFVADTGIPGRLDGLTTGTADVFRAIDELGPTVVLGGGDYAYFNSDSRFVTQSEAMDAWLRSIQSVTTDRPFMPTYGNHEVLLDEQVDQWVGRFATPEGDIGRTSYSFDVDGVHFVALMAYEGTVSPETMIWLTSDLDAARQRGVRAIVPFMHRNVYGDGTVHDPSPSLARQLTALFEWHDIDVVLTAHDQSFERTFPLAKGEPTTSARRCYTDADGITWVKTSPGGKLSNISQGFSGYSVTPPSRQIAVRENALHHFSTVTVTGSDLEVVTYGVVGDGSPAIVVDRFEYTTSCGPELSFSGQPAILDVAEQSAESLAVTVSVPDPAVAWSSSVPWLSVAAETLPGNALLTVDATQLSVGTHTASVRAELAGYDPTTLLVVVRVGVALPTGELVSFTDPNRTMHVTLEGAVLPSSAYLGLVPSGPLLEAAFVLDGTPLRIEDTPPFDAGGGLEVAAPLELADGVHTLEATLTAPTGATNTLSAQFSVAAACADGLCSTVPSASAAPSSGSSAAPSSESSAGSLGAPVLSPLGTLAPTVDRATQSSPTAGGDWWSKWPALLGAVALVGLFVGLITRINRRANRPYPTVQASPAAGTPQQRGTT
jgi:hypothetical protein